jgi:dynactin complex subunit|tara:strand:- start:491 stop:814 length:324 start_codon:yes stop_codon:yes gene_type:complete
MNKEQKRKFLRNLLESRESMKNTKKNQELKKMVEETFHGKSRTNDLYSKICQLQDNGLLPYIEIPHVLHTEEHGDLVFRIDKEQGRIKIMKRVYEWDSEKDNIDDEI